jgi:hypothetical protein
MALADLFSGIMSTGKTPQVADYFSDLNAPNPADMQLQLEELIQQGTISPEEAQTIMLGQSDMKGISLDPNLKKNQMAALDGLQDIVSGGGMTNMDMANLGRIKSQEDAAARGKRDAIIQSAEARGMGGSGLSMMDQLLNEQESATRNSQRDLDVAGMAQQRALEALMQQGQLSGQIANQDFSQKAQVAGANDAIAKFNAQNQQSQINQNVGARNTAQAQNLGLKQSIADSNTATRNTQQQANKNVLQQNFENEMAKRSGQAGIAGSNAANAGRDSQNQANANNQMIGALIGAGASAYGAKGKKQGGLIDGEPTEGDSVPTMLQPGEHVVRKEDVPEYLKKAHTDDDGEFDAAGFLDAITGHKYGYSKGRK